MFKRKITSAKIDEICRQITIAALMQPLQYELRCLCLPVSSQLISCLLSCFHLISALRSSCLLPFSQLFSADHDSSLLFSCHLSLSHLFSSQLLSASLRFSQLFSTLLSSPQLMSAHLTSSHLLFPLLTSSKLFSHLLS